MRIGCKRRDAGDENALLSRGEAEARDRDAAEPDVRSPAWRRSRCAPLFFRGAEETELRPIAIEPETAPELRGDAGQHRPADPAGRAIGIAACQRTGHRNAQHVIDPTVFAPRAD